MAESANNGEPLKTRKVRSPSERLEDLVIPIGEQFADFLIVVRAKDSHLLMRHSDSTWAKGAAERALELIEDRWHHAAEEVPDG